MNIGLRNLSLTVLGGMLFTFCGGLPAEAGDLRIATYNVRADTGSPDGGPGLTTVLQGIGNAILPDSNAQPVDVLALEELNYNNPSPSSTLQFIVSQLNAIYGAGDVRLRSSCRSHGRQYDGKWAQWLDLQHEDGD